MLNYGVIMLKSKTRVNIPDKLSNELFKKRCCLEVLEIRAVSRREVRATPSFYALKLHSGRKQNNL